jgi:thiamine biosynthesis lipoprotein
VAAALPIELMREHRFTSMGTDVVVLAPPDRPGAGDRVARLFAEWDRRFSRFNPDSELSRLNAAAGTTVEVSEPLTAAIVAAIEAARATDGLFDPLLERRMVELGYDRTFSQLPAARPEAPIEAWRAGAWRAITVDPIRRTVQLPGGTGIDLGGIAKGMAVDAAVALLAADGLPYAAVNAGGDLAVHGVPPDVSSWPIAVEIGLRHRTVTLRSGALATSSVLRRRWRVNGGERHHLLDPRTGLPARTGLAQATVAAATCRQAEIAAKVALLSGAAVGADFLERRGLAGLLLTMDGTEWHVGHWIS